MHPDGSFVPPERSSVLGWGVRPGLFLMEGPYGERVRHQGLEQRSEAVRKI